MVAPYMVCDELRGAHDHAPLRRRERLGSVIERTAQYDNSRIGTVGRLNLLGAEHQDGEPGNSDRMTLRGLAALMKVRDDARSVESHGDGNGDPPSQIACLNAKG